MAPPLDPHVLLTQLIDAAWQTLPRHNIPPDEMFGVLACAVLLHNFPLHHNDPELLLANILKSTPATLHRHDIPIDELIGILFCALCLRDDLAKASPPAPQPRPPNPAAKTARKKQSRAAGARAGILPAGKARRRRLTSAS